MDGREKLTGRVKLPLHFENVNQNRFRVLLLLRYFRIQHFCVSTWIIIKIKDGVCCTTFIYSLNETLLQRPTKSSLSLIFVGSEYAFPRLKIRTLFRDCHILVSLNLQLLHRTYKGQTGLA